MVCCPTCQSNLLQVANKRFHSSDDIVFVFIGGVILLVLVFLSVAAATFLADIVEAHIGLLYLLS